MTMSIPVPAPSRTPLWRRLLGNPLGAISAGYLLLLLLVAVIGPFVTPYPADQSVISDVLAPPGSEHLLGADSAGRDVLSRLLVATSTSLAAAALALIVAAAIGVTTGLIAGYRGGWFDTVSSWLSGTIMALPGIVVLLAARSVLGPSIWWIMAIFGMILAPSFHRIVYSAVRGVREELYIDAARVAGLSDLRIVARHVLSAIRAPVILLAAGLFAVAIAIQASLDFLGVGDPAVPTWGGILSDGFYNISRAPLLMVWPTLVIGLTCIALSLFGNALRDELERTGDTDRRRPTWTPPAERPDSPIDHGGEPGAAPLLVVDGLSVAYGVSGGWKTVVDDIALTVHRGEIHALIGESGSGKTQTAWTILGLLPAGGRPTSGTILFDGVDLTTLSDSDFSRMRGRRIGYVPQEPLSNLDPSFTIGDQLVEPMRVTLGLSREKARDRALELLEHVGIRDPRRAFRSYPHEISGGMAQRVLIAGAVSGEPELIIADEPTTALDVTVQAEILELLRRLQQESNLAMLMVTHNFGVVADLADRVSVMRTGSIVETGRVADVFGQPRHPYTRSLFGAVLDGVPARGKFQTTKDGERS
ncbi:MULTISPECIES: dipeptide/oligopeptide/nickel ABC transporter permease/ATP-binding protein [unclassified Microbacterium]|uniref:dipeptide/oligopeptide/nickel ABC transporter permease/ATP-binding protein n=1 Tax=unclassified Microbacterium TaxID=2609290 RepID=UPI000EA93DDC|nr:MULTISPECIES: dipeptide/oligopeptide/nickel ABC transporter permease/ATP-binding protein [unclassified Microbacterium]MBT2486492.1 dipeptide/oligopeptide/nickel ABC transporter permease/ATP-binding protein [Microbacterium sp. ISL-108]RKN69189.1 ATP-binding cassette domain-containing protein [Microbacterium sp. CGR2]